MRTGSLVVISVVDVESLIRSVRAAMWASSTGGLAGAANGGLWCSPVAKMSRPISSAFNAMATVFLMRSCSVGVRPSVGSVVTSPTVKMPNSIRVPPLEVVACSTEGCTRLFRPGTPTATRSRRGSPLGQRAPQPFAEAARPLDLAADGGPDGGLGADDAHSLLGPGDGGVEELPGEQARLLVGEYDAHGVGLRALGLVHGH